MIPADYVNVFACFDGTLIMSELMLNYRSVERVALETRYSSMSSGFILGTSAPGELEAWSNLEQHHRRLTKRKEKIKDVIKDAMVDALKDRDIEVPPMEVLEKEILEEIDEQQEEAENYILDRSKRGPLGYAIILQAKTPVCITLEYGTDIEFTTKKKDDGTYDLGYTQKLQAAIPITGRGAISNSPRLRDTVETMLLLAKDESDFLRMANQSQVFKKIMMYSPSDVLTAVNVGLHMRVNEIVETGSWVISALLAKKIMKAKTQRGVLESLYSNKRPA